MRLGKGKGSAKYWAYFAKKNEVLVELNSTNNKITKNLKNASLKLSLKSFFFSVTKDEFFSFNFSAFDHFFDWFFFGIFFESKKHFTCYNLCWTQLTCN